MNTNTMIMNKTKYKGKKKIKHNVTKKLKYMASMGGRAPVATTRAATAVASLQSEVPEANTILPFKETPKPAAITEEPLLKGAADSLQPEVAAAPAVITEKPLLEGAAASLQPEVVAAAPAVITEEPLLKEAAASLQPEVVPAAITEVPSLPAAITEVSSLEGAHEADTILPFVAPQQEQVSVVDTQKNAAAILKVNFLLVEAEGVVDQLKKLQQQQQQQQQQTEETTAAATAATTSLQPEVAAAAPAAKTEEPLLLEGAAASLQPEVAPAVITEEPLLPAAITKVSSLEGAHEANLSILPPADPNVSTNAPPVPPNPRNEVPIQNSIGGIRHNKNKKIKKTVYKKYKSNASIKRRHKTYKNK